MPVVGQADWEARRGLHWQAVHALRQAEELAKLADSVSGPADAAPKTEAEERSFIKDWATRARAALKRAYDWHVSRKDALQKRAREVGERIREGARRIAQASPAEAAKEGIADIARHAGGIAAWTFIGHGAAFLIAAWLFYEFVIKKGR